MQEAKYKKLIRFKDNTYAWNDDGIFSDIFSKQNAIAYGAWHLKINKNEIMKSVDILSKRREDSYALFSYDGKFLGADAIIIVEGEADINGEEIR